MEESRYLKLITQYWEEELSMMDFINSALPFIIIGLCLAIIIANSHKRG